MTTYRLPDGIEAETTEPGLVHVGLGHWLRHPSLGTIWVGADRLTEVKPPLPPEPPIGTVVLDGGDRAWQRVRDDRDPPWRHDSLMCSWETMVQDHGPLTVLKPDPADDAPELPWETIDNDGDRLQIRAINGVVEVAVTHGGRWQGVNVTAAVASGAGMALLRAAREVDTP